MRPRARIDGYFKVIFVVFLASSCPLSSAMVCSNTAQVLTGGTTGTDYLTVSGNTGECGGTLVFSERTEPKTLNPLIALDGNSREIIGLLMADLIHINRSTQQSESAIAKSWEVTDGGRRYTFHLRRGLRFSDGHPFDADDVVFTFRAYLDEKIHSPQRDLLIIDGKPLSVRKLDDYTVAFTLAKPYASAERLFDSVAILPRHLLQQALEHGTLANAWDLNTEPSQIVGLGPFQLKRYIPGQQMAFQKNKFFWKRDERGNQLPYLDELVSLFIPSPEAEVLRFEAGETQIVSRLNASDFDVLERDAKERKLHLWDVGSGMEYSFLLFNLNDLPPAGQSALEQKQRWFRQIAFRQAVSAAIDRVALVRLAYAGRADILSVQVSPGNKLWFDPTIPKPMRSLVRAKQLLLAAGYSYRGDGTLTDSLGKPVEFSILENSGRVQHGEMATIIQQDLKEIGIKINLVPLDFGSLVNRIFSSLNYETAILTLADGDADPNSEMNVLPSSGTTHVWKLRSNGVPDVQQHDIDQLMREQMITLDASRRRQLFKRVQHVLLDYQPVVFLVSPNVLAAASDRVGNFRPAVLSSYTLWNADQLFLRQGQSVAARR